MAKQLKKEIILLSLPVVLLAGCALWMSDASKFVRGAVAPTVSVGEILLMQRGPILCQRAWLDKDFGVILPLSVHDPFRRARQASVSLTQPMLSSANGKAPPPLPVVKVINYANYPGPSLFFDLDRVSPTLGQITLSALITPTKGPAEPLKIVVRPAWFTRPTKNLRLQKVIWTPNQNSDVGDVQVVLNYIGKQPLVVGRAQDYATTATQWKVKLTPNGTPGEERFESFNLLYNWSPRLESPDGKFSSLRATDAYTWGKYPAYFGTQNKSSSPFNGPDIAALLARYPLQLKIKDARRSGNTISITHHITGLNSHRGPLVFKTEIGVPGDGFLPVKCALSRVVSK